MAHFPSPTIKWVVETCHVMVGSSVSIKLTLALYMPLRHKGLSGYFHMVSSSTEGGELSVPIE